MANVKANGVKVYPEFSFGASPTSLNGIGVSVNSTVSGGTTKDHAIIGDFQNGFKWGYSKEIPIEIIKYGDPDNSGKDLKGYNQIYIRAEILSLIHIYLSGMPGCCDGDTGSRQDKGCSRADHGSADRAGGVI